MDFEFLMEEGRSSGNQRPLRKGGWRFRASLTDFLEVVSAAAAFAGADEADVAGFALRGAEDVDFAALAGAIALQEQGEAGIGGVVELEGDFADLSAVGGAGEPDVVDLQLGIEFGAAVLAVGGFHVEVAEVRAHSPWISSLPSVGAVFNPQSLGAEREGSLLLNRRLKPSKTPA